MGNKLKKKKKIKKKDYKLKDPHQLKYTLIGNFV